MALECAYRPSPRGQRCGQPASGKVRDLGEAFGKLRRQVVCDRHAALLDGRHAALLDGRPGRTVPRDPGPPSARP